MLKESFRLLVNHKKFFILPLVAVVLCWILLVSTFLPWMYFINLPQPWPTAQWQIFWLWYGLFLLAMFFCHLITFFFYSALIYSLHIYFSKNQIHLGPALKRTLYKFNRIFFWVLLTATWGIVINLFYRKIYGLYWKLATFFVPPLIVIENQTPLKALKRSAFLMKDNWGEEPKNNMRFKSILLLRLLALIPFIISLYIGGHKAHTIGFSITFLLLMTLTVFVLSLRAVMNLLTYYYANQQPLPEGFSSDTVKKAFLTK